MTSANVGQGQDRAGEAYEISSHAEQAIQGWLAKFPPEQARSAVIGALHAVQHDIGGYLTPAAIEAVARRLGLPVIDVQEVASFYSMFETRPVARHCVALCTNISCMLNGADELRDHIETRLGIREGQSTGDGRIYLKREEECLAACCDAPVMQVDHVYHEHLTPSRIDEILDGLE